MFLAALFAGLAARHARSEARAEGRSEGRSEDRSEDRSEGAEGEAEGGAGPGESRPRRLATEPARSPHGRALEREIRRLIAEFTLLGRGGEGASVAVAVLGDSGETLADIRGGDPLKPASNMKVLTTAAALHWLGPSYEFETTLTASAPLRNGVVPGDVIVRGTGDPNISGRFAGGDPRAIFRSWARRLRDAGLRRIDGNLVADDGFFDDVRLPPSWDPRQADAWYSAQVSALSLNDNCIDITVRPGRRAGAKPAIEAEPPSPLVEIKSSMKTVAAGSPRVLVHRRPGTNRFTVTGEIPAGGQPWSGSITLHDPALFFVTVLASVLESEGIVLGGKAVRLERSSDSLEARAALAAAERPPQGAKEVNHGGSASRAFLLRHTSTLLEDLPVINKRSQNLHAEILLKVLGARVGGEGSLEGGARALRKFLAEKKIAAAGLAVGDGSGLSHRNRVSAHLLAAVLHSVKSETHFDAYLRSLPVAGEDGTLDTRFRGAPDLKGRVHAKTGYIAGVSCLSGYVVRGPRTWSFSILVNDLRAGAHGAKRLQEKIGQRIYEAMGPRA